MRPRSQCISGAVLAIAFAMAAALPVSSARAVPQIEPTVDEGVDKFGHYNQNALDACIGADSQSKACAVFAALNSVIYLQNEYPGIYDNPDGTGKLVSNPAGLSAVVTAANTLAADVNCCNAAININNLITAKPSSAISTLARAGFPTSVAICAIEVWLAGISQR